MQQKLVYMMGKPPSREALAAVMARKAPRAEYNVFLQRHPSPLVSLADLARSTSRVSRALIRRRLQHFALAWETLNGDYESFLTAGEDVGLPLALLSMVRGDRRPIYIITHGSYFASGKFARLMGLLRRRKNVSYLCLSQSLRERLIGEFHAPSAHVFNTSYATDTEFFRLNGAGAAPSGGMPVLASVGAASRDYRTLVQAATDLPVQVKIGADSAWFPVAVDIEGSELPANVDVRKYAYPELKRLYAEALFVVIPLYDGKHACGYSAIAEAMSMGKAVIATKTTNPSDFLVDGVNGLFVRPGDVADLREKIQLLLDRPDLAREMGQRARTRMEQEYSVEAYSTRIERVLKMA